MENKRAGHDPRTLLRGEHVNLRPLEIGDLALYCQWENDPEMSGPYMTPRPISRVQVEHDFADRVRVGEERGVFAVSTKDGTPVGRVSYFRLLFAPFSYGYNIGVGIMGEHRGHGYGAEAQRLLADYLLFAFAVGRVEASTDVENVAEQRSLERAGFRRDGVIRKGWWRGGRWHDIAVYSRVQGDD